ncbi:hypothetical protein HYZ41_04240 [archaeon]|nr:hypothetical protein [archaeon]
MNHEEYLQLMKSVSSFGKRHGLNIDKLYRDNYTSTDYENWVISVSWKTRLDNSNILYSHEDEYSSDFDTRLKFPIVVGPRKQIDKYRIMSEEKCAEYFSKKSIASNGFVQPSPEFLALSTVEKVEYTLHEAFHNTSKLFFGNKQDNLPPAYEEASALTIGYVGCVHYFDLTDLKPQAIAHCQKYLNLARLVNGFYNELNEVLGFRIGEDKSIIQNDQKMQEREELLERAKTKLGNELGGPINNAFFIYWNYFYEKLEKMHDKVRDLKDFGEVVQRLRTFDRWY